MNLSKKTFLKKEKMMKKTWNKIMVFINRIPQIEKAIILTLLCMTAILSSMALVHLRSHSKEIMIEMTNLPEEVAEKDSFLEEDFTEQSITENTKVTTYEYNEADLNLIHSDNDFKTLEQIFKERSMTEANEKLLTTANISTNISISAGAKLETSKIVSLENKPHKINKNSLVRYSLTERFPIGDLPNPVFTCEVSGKIVVNIKVAANGEVTETTFNETESTTANGCLVENALHYASQARFEASTIKEQKGTITYFYQGK